MKFDPLTNLIAGSGQLDLAVRERMSNAFDMDMAKFVDMIRQCSEPIDNRTRFPCRTERKLALNAQ
jgi:hypothetical protein